MLVPAAVATALLVALACAAAVVTSRPPGGGGVVRAPAPVLAPAGAAEHRAGAGASTSAPPESSRPRPVAVLRAWDARRGAAWAAGDTAALDSLYAAGSAAGEADVAMLRAWRARGLRVTGLRPQLLAVEVVARGPGRLIVRVTERLGRAVAVGPGVRRVLPISAPATRRVELRRDGGGWRVVEAVEAGPPRGAQARPAASTSRTSRSWKT